MSRRSSTDQAAENFAIFIIGAVIAIAVFIILIIPYIIYAIYKSFEKSPEEQLRSMGEVPVWGARIISLPCPICNEQNEASAVICYRCGTNMVQVRQSIKWKISQRIESLTAQVNEYGQRPSQLTDDKTVADEEYVILAIGISTVLGVVLITMLLLLIF